MINHQKNALGPLRLNTYQQIHRLDIFQMRTLHNESMLNLDVAFTFRIAQTANKSELSTLSASESSRTLRPFITIKKNLFYFIKNLEINGLHFSLNLQRTEKFVHHQIYLLLKN